MTFRGWHHFKQVMDESGRLGDVWIKIRSIDVIEPGGFLMTSEGEKEVNRVWVSGSLFTLVVPLSELSEEKSG